MLKDPLYIGLRHKRIRGQAYDDLLDEFMEAVTSRYVIYLCYSLVNSIVNFILGEINVLSYVNLSYVKQCLNLPSLQVLGLHALCTDSLKIKNPQKLKTRISTTKQKKEKKVPQHKQTQDQASNVLFLSDML